MLRQQGREIALTTFGLSDIKKFRQNLRLALDRGLTDTDALAALTTVPAILCGVESQLGTIEAGKLANLTVVVGTNYFDAESKVREVWIDGRIHRVPAEEPKPAPETVQQKKKEGASGEEKQPGKAGDKKKEQLRELRKARVARSPLEGRGPVVEPKAILIERATVWTCGTNGVLTNAQILVSGGRIEGVGYLGKIKTAPDTPCD